MSLKVLVVGVGPVGLAAAIAIATQGHIVELFEKSAFSREIGAAMQFAPQAVRMLRELGLSMEDLNARPCERWCYYDDLSMDAKPFRTAWMGSAPMMTDLEWTERASRLGISEPQVMVHRVDAHDALRNKALSLPNVHLHLSAGVTRVDTKGTVTLENGQSYTGDLIIGADGVHSTVVNALASQNEDLSAHFGLLNMYRFMIPSERMLDDPLVSQFFTKLDWQNSLNGFDQPGRILIVYLCRGTSLLNCATFLRRHLDEAPIAAGTWNTPGTKEQLLAALDGFPDHLRRLVPMADDIKHWSSVMRHCPQTYVKDRTVVIGDAAHPMPPTYGAGAGLGVEDACVLTAILDKDALASEVESLLPVYNDVRYERGTVIKYASHALQDPKGATAKLETLVPGSSFPNDIWDYMWAYDGVAVAKEALAKYRAGMA